MEETPLKQQPFVRKKKLQTMFKHVSGEMYKQNLQLVQTNKTLSILRKIDELALESQESLEVFANVLASAIAATNSYPLVAILTQPHTHKNSLKLYGLSLGHPVNEEQRALFAKVQIDTSGEWFQGKEKAKVIDFQKIPLKQLKQSLSFSDHDVKQIKQLLPIHSLLIVKLTARDRLVGLMAIGFLQEQDKTSADELDLFERLSEAVGVAVDNKLLFEENKHIMSQLQKTNEKLKALDEAKDEFISMASHQLRTPLTSVKGYLSMVIEGDTGKVTKDQKKLLDQAFTSSQRMVYLIADLLNVSRLRTGKFVIETVPTDLADVVEGELDQLRETAAARKLSLIYKKPKDFPILMLDETKTRQVIMNFVDNAIYYTPPGGHITVELENKRDSIELRVIDDGLGVPKSEQHHLFGKFFRADNAQKARPDGTGLGLFMAKKVIIAQGGSLIFKSTEGKGSTFGFTFSKAKLQVPSNKTQD